MKVKLKEEEEEETVFLFCFMGSLERSKKKLQTWKRARVHFALCFIVGYLTGIAPINAPSILSTRLGATQVLWRPKEMMLQRSVALHASNVSRSLAATSMMSMEFQEESQPVPSTSSRRLLVIVTPIGSTENRRRYRRVFLGKLANTLKLVPPPLLWIIVERQLPSSEVPGIVAKMGITYRHLQFNHNFTCLRAELDHQINVALKHIELHRISGIVHFAEIANVYDLNFFDELREIEVFGAWHRALVRLDAKKLILEQPVCNFSQVIGWHAKKMDDEGDKRPPIHISNIVFNSSILWDPERWGRSSQLPLQNSLKFIEQVALEDESKLKGIPRQGCSRILMWQLHFP